MTADARHLKSDANRRTPEHVLALAREVMGGIDLDPASDVEAQKVVKAKYWLGPGAPACKIEPNGLYWQWDLSEVKGRPARVWLNPPGGVLDPKTLQPRPKGPGISSAAVWWAKLVHEYNAERVSEALFLAFTLEVFRTGQVFARPPQTFPFCIPRGRLRFPSSNGGTVNAPAAASAIVYLGPNVARFRSVFGQIGVCV